MAGFLNNNTQYNAGANLDFSNLLKTTDISNVNDSLSASFGTDLGQGQGQNFAYGQNGGADPTNWLSSFSNMFNKDTLESALGGKEGAGWLTNALGIGTNLLQGYTGLEKLKLGKQQLAETSATNKANLNNSVSLLNTQQNNRYNNQYDMASAEEKAKMLSTEAYAEKNNLQGRV